MVVKTLTCITSAIVFIKFITFKTLLTATGSGITSTLHAFVTARDVWSCSDRSSGNQSNHGHISFTTQFAMTGEGQDREGHLDVTKLRQWGKKKHKTQERGKIQYFTIVHKH